LIVPAARREPVANQIKTWKEVDPVIEGVAANRDIQIVASPSTYPRSKRSAVHKVAEVLRAVSGGRARSLTSISEETGLPLSTVFRIANELVQSGLLHRSCEGFYSMSQPLPHADVDPDRAGATSVIPRAAIAVLDDLAAVTHKTSRFGFRQGAHMASVTRKPNRSQVQPHTQIDQRPLHACAMGKVLLAFAIRPDFDDAMKRELQGYAANTVTDRDTLLEQLARIRRKLVAYEFGELDEQTSTIAVPVLGAGRFAVAALELESTGEPDLRRLEYAAQIAACVLRKVMLARPAS
jgi:DNA-binding IclR family transcriptional regulator